MLRIVLAQVKRRPKPCFGAALKRRNAKGRILPVFNASVAQRFNVAKAAFVVKVTAFVR